LKAAQLEFPAGLLLPEALLAAFAQLPVVA
jgi:hypothetical protein